MILELGSIYEAKTLLSAIGSAKFGDTPPYDIDLLASPILARVASELSKMICEYDKKRWGEIGEQDWEAWYWLTPERREWKVALNYGSLACKDMWQKASLEWRVQFVSLLVNPFGLTEELQSRIFSELDELNQKQINGTSDSIESP